MYEISSPTHPRWSLPLSLGVDKSIIGNYEHVQLRLCINILRNRLQRYNFFLKKAYLYEKKCLYWSYFVFCLYLYRALFSSTLYCYCTFYYLKDYEDHLTRFNIQFPLWKWSRVPEYGYYINLKTQIIQKFMHIF